MQICLFNFACAGSRNLSMFHSEPNVRVKITASGARNTLEIPLETYLAGVIGHEMSPRWPEEALKAQTIAARSYALFQMQTARQRGRGYDVVDSQADQVFRESGTRNSYLQSVVEKTHGEVLMKDGKIVQAFYSSTCGGQTETAAGAELSYDSPLIYAKEDTFCSISPFRSWTISMSAKELTQRLQRRGFSVKNLRSLTIKEKNPSGYVKTLEYTDERGTTTVPGKTFRQLAGNMRLKSLLFDVCQGPSGSYVFNGHGFGHGVGMCQYGAKEMSLEDKDYKKILAQYYNKIKIQKIY